MHRILELEQHTCIFLSRLLSMLHNFGTNVDSCQPLYDNTSKTGFNTEYHHQWSSTSNSSIMKYLVQGLWYYHTCILNWNKWEYDFIEYCHHHESLFPPHLYGMGAAALSSAFFSSWQHNRMQSPVECPVQNNPQKCLLSCPPCPRSDARYLLYWKGCVESSSIRQHHQCFLWTSHLLSKSPSLKKYQACLHILESTYSTLSCCWSKRKCSLYLSDTLFTFQTNTFVPYLYWRTIFKNSYCQYFRPTYFTIINCIELCFCVSNSS